MVALTARGQRESVPKTLHQDRADPTKMLAGPLVALLSVVLLAASSDYAERLTLRPLPRNKLLTTFQFDSDLPPHQLQYVGAAEDQVHLQPRHYGQFPKSLDPVILATNTRLLHLRFTQGWWDGDSWGGLPQNGFLSGGTGVELLATIEAVDLEAAKLSWLKLAESLSGFFCALLNFIDFTITTFPQYDAEHLTTTYAAHANSSLYYMRAALPDEPICTENLTPFLKMLPTRGKAGISSLLDGHKLYDSLWHSMSIDITTECLGADCWLKMTQEVSHVIDVVRLLRRKNEGGVPKPTPGDKMRCDLSKKHDAWTCFPLGEPTELEWDLEGLYGRPIKGAGFDDESFQSDIHVDVDFNDWNVQLIRSEKGEPKVESMSNTVALKTSADYNLRFETNDTTRVTAVSPPPIFVSRSFTGYSLDKGGMRVNIRNPSDSETLLLVYYEALPWFMRVYLHTLVTEGLGKILSRFYRPSIDRVRPTHLEMKIEVAPGGQFTFNYQFDKSLLLYAEYPPDANHGFGIAPAIVKVLDAAGQATYQMRTTSLLLTLPTPDFSMPYNVIILTCTVMSLAFGTVFNLLTKKVVTEEELEESAKNSKIAKLKARIRAFKQRKSVSQK